MALRAGENYLGEDCRSRGDNEKFLLSCLGHTWSFRFLKRWQALTHQGGVSHEHLPYYFDEFTFRRRKSKSRGKLSFRLVQQAAEAGSTTCAHIAKPPQNLPRINNKP